MLSPEVADAIAAGEVVERPASVVKELVENALDAGARRITIDVRGAGKASIRVSDDGAGIPAAELALAFVRHTTSKLSSLADLAVVASFGFRGEALASIAAVADVECTSGGAILRLRHGEVVDQGTGPLLPGVAIEVRDLFANVPARLKFLKSDATEVAAVKEVVSAFALLHPQVRFHLTIDSRAALSTSGDADRRRAVASVYGSPVAAEMLELIGPSPVAGMVSQPRLSRGSRDGMVLAVNGRPISARSLVYALEECYQGRLERGRHPLAVIDVGIDPELVDVNVHPAKKEVRFRDEGAVFAALQRAVRASLDGSDPFRYRPLHGGGDETAAIVAGAPHLELHDAPAAIALEESNGHSTATTLLVGSARPLSRMLLRAPRCRRGIGPWRTRPRAKHARAIDRRYTTEGMESPRPRAPTLPSHLVNGRTGRVRPSRSVREVQDACLGALWKCQALRRDALARLEAHPASGEPGPIRTAVRIGSRRRAANSRHARAD